MRHFIAKARGKLAKTIAKGKILWSQFIMGLENLSKKEREIFFRSLGLSFLILPMLSVPMISAAYLDSNYQGQKSFQQIAGIVLPEVSSNLRPAKAQTVVPPQPPPQTETSPPPPPPLPELTNTQNLNPVLLQRFFAFREFIFNQYGVVLTIKSGWRSFEEQAQLYRTLPPGYANPPGTSNHEKGQAIDYTPYGPQYNQHLAQFGLKLAYPGKEEWHVEIVEPH